MRNSYFEALIGRSEVVQRDPEGDLTLCDGGWLVFGGDACDRGPGDIRITKALCSLKRRYPDRVILLQGNRDALKLRFGSELDPTEAPGAGDKHWKDKYSDYLDKSKLAPGRISGCKWILYTMGCEGWSTDTFSARRDELGLLGLPNDDDSVVESMYESVNPSGSDPWMLEYLRLSEVVATVGDCLFVHAGIVFILIYYYSLLFIVI